jgi:transcriptional regulator with XRE-family HTH domain
MSLSRSEYKLLTTYLRHYREKAGLTQAELAKRSGVHAVCISLYESGKHRPRPATAERLFKGLSGVGQLPSPPVRSTGIPVGARSILCPHCGAPNHHYLERLVPGVEFVCVSCSRTIRLDGRGLPIVQEARRAKRIRDGFHREPDQAEAK